MAVHNGIPDKRIERSVIAYAFLAQASRGEGIILSGLAPLLKPIAKIHAGEDFDSVAFSEYVNDLYGLKIHPWAIEDLAPRLEKAGLISRIQLSEDMHKFIYTEINENFDDVTENDIKDVISRFIEFAIPILLQNKIPVNETNLEEGFLSQLVDMDFISILLKPDRTKEDRKTSETISLKKSENQKNWEENISEKSKIDVLCASFIVDAYRNDQGLYGLIMKIATGAILSEVILNFQDPGDTVKLDGLKIVLDAPFLMSALDLSSEESFTFASEICNQLREKGAQLVAYQHSIEELSDNLKAVIRMTEHGSGFGPTARRLSSPAFSAYANSVLNNIDTVLKKEDIRRIAIPETTAQFQFFTDQDQKDFYYELGYYENKLAQQRDAESVAATVRLRKGKRVRMGLLPDAAYIFITENNWVAEKSEEFLRKRNLFESGEVPPAMSEKHLAGLLWAIYGGKGKELTRYLLLANCAAALEPRSDVIAQMHRFLSQVDKKQAELFHTLMTQERAGQYAMQLTLGDSSFITRDNAPEILEQIRRTLIEEHEIKKQMELESIQEIHKDEISKKNQVESTLRHDLLEANSENLDTQSELKDSKSRIAQIQGALENERGTRKEEELWIMARCVRSAARFEKQIHISLGLFFAIVICLISWFGVLEYSSPESRYLAIFLIGLITFLSFWKVPDLVLAKWVHRFRERKFESSVNDLGMNIDPSDYIIDWSNETVATKRK